MCLQHLKLLSALPPFLDASNCIFADFLSLFYILIYSTTHVLTVRSDDDFEVLELSDANKSWIKNQFKDISKQSMAKQLAIGGAGGW